MTIFIDITGFGVIIPLLPFFAASLQAGSTALGILVASFAIMQFFFSPILGRISDNVGRRPILLLSILTSLVSFILFSIANSFLILLLSRVIAGMATETAVAQAYIADITSKRERATGLGRIAAAHGAGFIVGPAMGGFLSIYGFWAAGIAAAVLTLVNLLFVFFFVPESINRKHLQKPMVPTSEGYYLQRFLKAIAKPIIGAVFAILFVVTFAFSAIPVIAPLLGRDFFNIGPVEMSYFFIYIGSVQVLLQGFVVGKLTKQIGEEKLIAAAALLMAIGMAFTPLIPHILNFLVSLTIAVLGLGIMNTVIPSFISKNTSADEQGGMLGTAQSISSIACVPGPLLGGVIYEFVGLSAPFFVSAALLIGAFVIGCRVFQMCTREPT
ncbi:MAG: MFS transporter [Candidatus Hodarchaeota archaeon]